MALRVEASEDVVWGLGVFRASCAFSGFLTLTLDKPDNEFDSRLTYWCYRSSELVNDSMNSYCCRPVQVSKIYAVRLGRHPQKEGAVLLSRDFGWVYSGINILRSPI